MINCKFSLTEPFEQELNYFMIMIYKFFLEFDNLSDMTLSRFSLE